MEGKANRNEQAAKNAAVKKMSPQERAARTPKSCKLAIAAYCYHECHNEKSVNSHTIKRAIKNCTVTGCPLWLHRGWQKTGGNAVYGKATPVSK